MINPTKLLVQEKELIPVYRALIRTLRWACCLAPSLCCLN